MNITITKRTVTIDKKEFIKELKELADVLRKNTNSIAIGVKTINKEFGLKLTDADFYKLANELGFTIKLNCIRFTDIDDLINKEK